MSVSNWSTFLERSTCLYFSTEWDQEQEVHLVHIFYYRYSSNWNSNLLLAVKIFYSWSLWNWQPKILILFCSPSPILGNIDANGSYWLLLAIISYRLHICLQWSFGSQNLQLNWIGWDLFLDQRIGHL